MRRATERTHRRLASMGGVIAPIYWAGVGKAKLAVPSAAFDLRQVAPGTWAGTPRSRASSTWLTGRALRA